MNKEFDNSKVIVYFEDDLSKDEYNIKISNINNRENKTINYVNFISQIMKMTSKSIIRDIKLILK